MTRHDGFDAALIDAALEPYVRAGTGGLSWAVGADGSVVRGSLGHLDPPARTRPVHDDAIYRIASVSKPIGAVAALQLVDDGLIGLDDPIDEALPELARRRVLLDPGGAPDGPTEAAERPLTLRDLLSFRCGLGMDFDFSSPQPTLDRMWELGVGPGPTGPEMSASEYLKRLSTLALIDQPGTRWRYHTGSDIAGVLVERLRNQPLDVVLSERIFEPLTMVDTGFVVPASTLDRFGVCRQGDDDGELFVWDLPDGRWAAPPEFLSASTGLVSTTNDLVKFAAMVLGDGAVGDIRVLSEPLTREMCTDQLTDEQRHATSIDSDGVDTGWGLGVAVRAVDHHSGWPTAGTVSWDGGLGSRWIVDPHHQLCAVLLSTDGFTSPSAPEVMVAFVDAIRAQLIA